MHVKGKVCVVTGAASGIGEAVARAYAEAGARGVVVADLKTSRDRLAKVAGDIDGLAITGDVGLEEDIKALVAAAEDKYGPVDVFFSNAGLSRKGQESASDADWDVSWRVHVMSHVFAARALVPGMLARGSGYLLNTASAAGLLAPLVKLGDAKAATAIETLRVYLDCWGSLARSGAVLHLHPNAVAHRMKRIRALLAADLDDPDQRLALQIACRAWSGGHIPAEP